MATWLTLLIALAPGQVPAKPDAVYVCPPAWRSTLAPLVEHRQRQGHSITFLDSNQSSESIRNSICRLSESPASNPSRLRYVVLFGDAPAISTQPGKLLPNTIPTWHVPSKVMVKFGSEPTIATDNPYGDTDGDGVPELAVGRVPVESPAELKTYIKRLIDYELQGNAALWRQDVHVVAGVGGFGMIIDNAIEMTARYFLSEGIPPGYRLSLTQAGSASAYSPRSDLFRTTVLDRFNQGGLFWIYIGHGNIQHLDFVPVGQDYDCIMDQESLPLVKTGKTPPIAVFLACYTGAFDASKDSLAEQLVVHPEGPIAAIAGSRVTGPYGMSSIASEMLDVCFRDEQPSLGEVFLQGKQRSMATQPVDAVEDSDQKKSEQRRQLLDTLAKALSPEGHDLQQERYEHLHMLNLLGDPMLKLLHPEKIELQVPAETIAGEPLMIKGIAPHGGQLQIELAYRRDRVPENARKAMNADAKPDAQTIYQLANQATVYEEVKLVAKGPFELQIPVQETLKGGCTLRAAIQGDQHWALGAVNIQVKSKRSGKTSAKPAN